MNENIVKELETAAGIIMAPPNLVTNEQRHNAEIVFMNFRKCKSPFRICKDLLDNCQIDYVLFEAAETLKSALIREWSFLLESDKVSLRQYLMHYIINRQQLPSFVRDRLLQVIAIMVKRASIDDNGRERSNILTEVENIILNAETEKKILGFNIIANLMQEYASTIKSSDVGLPWEIHFRAKKQFESTDLKRIFKFCIQLLVEIVKNDPPYPNNILELTRHILKVTENTLTWGYISPLLPKRLIGIYESVYEADQAPALRLNDNWSDIILSPQLLPLMFQIYWKFKDIEELAHHSITCLVQLASLNGGILATDDVRLDYLKSYLENFSTLVSSVTIKNKESLGISNIVKKLVLFFIHDIQKLPAELQNSCLDELTRLTCSFCKGAAIDETNVDDDHYFNDAFDNMMEAWTNILQEFSIPGNNDIKECAVQIFNTYVQYHLGPPDGQRQNQQNEQHDIEDNEDSDRITFKDQLQTIGMFGRIIPGHCLTILYRLLEMNTEKLKMSLQIMEQRAMTMDESTVLNNIFEDIHWLILISGHILCMDSDGETPMIPSEMMQYSIEQLRLEQSTLDASLNCLASIQQIQTQPCNIDLCDHILRIVCDVLRLCAVEKFAAEANLGHLLSPEVGSTIMWFLKRWCLSYLLPIENYYHELSPILVGAVGKDTEGATFVVNFILDKIYSNIWHFGSEPILLKDTVELLTALVCIKQKQSLCIIKSKSLWNLIELQEKLEAGRLPGNIRCDLWKSFVLAGVALRDVNEMGSYFKQILQPLETKCNELMLQESVQRNYHKEDVQKQVIDLLECFIGITKGSHMTTVNILFNFLSPKLATMPKILQLYNNYQVIVQLILELFGQCAKNMLCYLCQLDSKKLYESTLATVQAYAKCNSNKFTNETLAEESNFQDIALILDLLTFILSKDCIDLCPNLEEITVTASDVSLFGLNFIMPLMTIDLLKYPSLCSQYYRLLVLINDIYPEKICNLPSNLFQQLLSSIELGLTQFSSDTAQASLDFIQGMAAYFYRNKLETTLACELMKPFLKLLLDLTLSHQINTDLMSSASTCIYSLICCYKDEYKSLVDGLIKSQIDPLVADRLSAAFHNLTLNVPMTGERQPKLKFRDNFDKFIANVHGFLLVK